MKKGSSKKSARGFEKGATGKVEEALEKKKLRGILWG